MAHVVTEEVPTPTCHLILRYNHRDNGFNKSPSIYLDLEEIVRNYYYVDM